MAPVPAMRGWRALRPAGSAALSSGRGGPPRRRAWEASLSPLERVKRLLEPPRGPGETGPAGGKRGPWVPSEVAAPPAAPGAATPCAERASWAPPEVAAPQGHPGAREAAWVPPEVATPWALPGAKADPCVPPDAKVSPRAPPEVATPQAPPEAKPGPKIPPRAAPLPVFPEGKAAPQAPVEAGGAHPGAFRAGELALAVVQRKYNRTLKLLCRLAADSVLASPGGHLPHRDIIGQLPGQLLTTSAGAQVLLRRPSLEEYVLLMPRGPTITYPKDISAVLMMMDIHPGDTVLETGSGSGALSLFLSRAVGPTGRVLSYEVRDDHHNLAKKNYRHWRDAWAIGHGEEWPDNVEFVLKDISTAAADMKSVALDAVVLDMLSPQCALPVVQPSLKLGGVCAVYLANITQVIDLLDRVRTCRLPFVCEKIIEVTHRNWLVVPAKRKNSKSRQRAETPENAEEPPQTEYEEMPIQDEVALKERECNGSLLGNAGMRSSVPYIARPAFWQEGHSAFLSKLQKFGPLSS